MCIEFLDMNLNQALDWGLGLGVLFLLMGNLVIPQFSAAITSAAGINDTITGALVTTVLGLAFLISVVMVVKKSYKEK